MAHSVSKHGINPPEWESNRVRTLYGCRVWKGIMIEILHGRFASGSVNEVELDSGRISGWASDHYVGTSYAMSDKEKFPCV